MLKNWLNQSIPLVQPINSLTNLTWNWTGEEKGGKAPRYAMWFYSRTRIENTTLIYVQCAVYAQFWCVNLCKSMNDIFHHHLFVKFSVSTMPVLVRNKKLFCIIFIIYNASKLMLEKACNGVVILPWVPSETHGNADTWSANKLSSVEERDSATFLTQYGARKHVMNGKWHSYNP